MLQPEDFRQNIYEAEAAVLHCSLAAPLAGVVGKASIKSLLKEKAPREGR